MRRRTISEHGSDQSASSISRNSRLIAEYNNLQSSYEQSNMSSFEQDLELGNSKQTLKNKTALRMNQLEPTGHRLIDTSSYYIPPPERRRVRSFLNQSGRQRSRVDRYQSRVQQSRFQQSRLQQSYHSKQQEHEQLQGPLITLPEPQPTSAQVGYLLYLNRYRNLSKPYDFAKQVLRRNNDISMAEQFQKSHHRCFEQAKLRYYDNMVPAKLKVGNNALRMYKHREKKRENSRLMMQLAQI